ncbi:MAG TPA: M48 family metallopeptidase [Candidatus Goldiibacteriota bacterium]|nr:M48 family metallopeptidase [Candidatus Goldiibacteriota bacterium]HRQ44304.1 M48 family metallopeptidase [Candidatus Goldiibacteriota bacterium]
MKRILSFVMALFFITSCATLTSTKYDPVLIPESMESQMGLATKAQVDVQYKALANTTVQSYVSALGGKLAAKSERSTLKYTFTVVDSPEINAFAVPGGFVYVTSGIIKNLNDEAQLAAVIGHEIGHIAKKHSVKQMQRQLVAQYGLAYVENMMSKGEEGTTKSQIASMVSAIGLNFLFAKNSRENEFEADEQGAFLSSAAGYDPKAMIDVQELLLKLRTSKPGMLEQMLSTHPISEERIAHAGEYISAQGLASTARNKTAFDKIKAAIK